MNITEEQRYELAKSFTELAIQNKFISPCEDAVDTAKEITALFNSIADTLHTAND